MDALTNGGEKVRLAPPTTTLIVEGLVEALVEVLVEGTAGGGAYAGLCDPDAMAACWKSAKELAPLQFMANTIPC